MNLIIDRSNRLANEWCWEWHYIMNVLREIESKDDKHQYIFTDNVDELPVEATKNSIVIIVSDERYCIPKYTEKVKAIFKNYALPNQEEFNIFPIPQGHNKDLIFYPYKPINLRKYDIAFQGNFHTSRPIVVKKILEEIEERNLNINFLLKESENAFQYSNNLWDTKISLCLDGQITPENFRFFESSILGCAILASNQLPKNWIYNKNHYFKVDWNNPREIVDIITNLLNNKDLLDKYSLESYRAWNTIYNAKSVANYIINKINE